MAADEGVNDKVTSWRQIRQLDNLDRPSWRHEITCETIPISISGP